MKPLIKVSLGDGYYRCAIIIVAVFFGLLLALLASPVSAQDGFSLDGGIPSEATTGEQISIGASVSTPDLLGNHESELEVALLVNGEQVKSETITVKDGETSSLSFDYTFDSTGSHTVEIEAGLTIAGQTFGDSISSSVDVAEIEAPSTESVETGLPGESKEIQGAAFSVPPSLKDEVSTYRGDLPVSDSQHAFVLATEDQLYIVFTSKEPAKGSASVEGRTLQPAVSANGLSFGLLAADSVSFKQTGAPISVSEVLNSPSDNNLDLVRIQSTYREISSLTDPDSGRDFTAASSAGVLVDDPTTTKELMTGGASRAGSFSIQASSDKLGSGTQAEAASILQAQPSHLYTFDFETQFWTDSEATVDGIVLLPGSQARQFISTFYQSGLVPTDSDRPILYVVDSARDSNEYRGVSSLKSESTDGELVSIETNLYGQTVSVQETLEATTACGQEKAQVPTPNGPICVDIVQDSLIHGGVAWTDVPQDREDMLFILGISSRHMDSPSEPIQGRYRITGEVVSTSRFDSSLQDGKMLIVYDLERTGDLQLSSMAAGPKRLIEGENSQLDDVVKAQIQESPKTVGDKNSQTDPASGQTTQSTENPPDQSDSDRDDDENVQEGGLLRGIGDLIDDILGGLKTLLG